MTSKIHHIKKSELTTSTWSGGTTTQLAIYPETGDYANRDFNWRISTATVEVDESTFTSLPGVHRFIMSLEGDLKLVHEGHHTSELKPYEVDEFDGSWNTQSFGKVTDFNLMVQGQVQGNLRSAYVTHDQPLLIGYETFTDAHTTRVLGFYAPECDVECTTPDARLILEKGDVFIAHDKFSARLGAVGSSGHVCIFEILLNE